MITSRKFLAGLAVATLLSACAYAPTWTAVGTRLYQQSQLEPYTTAKSKIPPQPDGHYRIYVYRPQTFVGMSGNAVVIVDGKWMGNINDPVHDNLLLPGTVFIVDSLADVTRVWWYQGGKGDESDKALSLPSADSRTWYLRWSLKPTYGYLETVSEQQPLTEIESLHFTGYVELKNR